MEQTMTGMDYKIREVALRIRELREISGFSTAEMAQRTGLTEEEYIQCESGKKKPEYRIFVSLHVKFRR